MYKLIQNVGFDTVVNEMRRIAQEGVQSSNVVTITQQAITGKIDSITAIWDYIKSHMTYNPDPDDTELLIHPNRLAQDFLAGAHRSGDCDDFAMLTASMLGCLGRQVRMCIINYGSDSYHAVCEVWSDFLDRWVCVDTASQIPLGWEVPYYSKQIITV